MIYQNDDFRYDSETGLLYWNRDVVGGLGGVLIRKGTLCGQVPNSNGYLQVKLAGKNLKQHRIMWFIVHGQWPKEIDHIDGIRVNNKLYNLRDVTNVENSRNGSLRIDNTSGVLGVTRHSQTNAWVAQINVDNKQKHLGYFPKVEDAIAARKAANIKYGFHKNHGKKR